MMYKIISIYSKLSNDSREIGNRYYLFDMLIINFNFSDWNLKKIFRRVINANNIFFVYLKNKKVEMSL